MKKYILLIIVLSIHSLAKGQAKKDTTYMLVGYNCTLRNGNTRDGNWGVKFTGKFPTAKQIEDPLIKSFGLVRVVILSIYKFRNRSEYETFWSQSNYIKP